MEELLARVRAPIRRVAAGGHAAAELTCGPMALDTRSGRVTVNGSPVQLSAQEYRVLAYLMHHKGRVVSRTELTEHIYAQDFDRDSNTIEVFIGRLRRKLGVDDLITTVRGLATGRTRRRHRDRRRLAPLSPARRRCGLDRPRAGHRRRVREVDSCGLDGCGPRCVTGSRDGMRRSH